MTSLVIRDFSGWKEIVDKSTSLLLKGICSGSRDSHQSSMVNIKPWGAIPVDISQH